MADVARSRAALETAGTQVAFVHMSPPEVADRWFAHHGLSDVRRVSDPGKALYRAFGLEDATLAELLHPRVWLRWLRTAIAGRPWLRGAPGPDWRQLPGVFLVRDGRILAAIRHRNSAARPDYLSWVQNLNRGATMR